MDIEATFPKFIKIGEQSTYIRVSYDKWTGYATYWRPCGEWGFQIKCEHYAYYQKTSFNHDWKNIEVLPCSPQEFLHDNSYCTSEKTAQYFKEAWEAIPKELKIEQKIYQYHNNWYHEEQYKDVNYIFAGFEL